MSVYIVLVRREDVLEALPPNEKVGLLAVESVVRGRGVYVLCADDPHEKALPPPPNAVMVSVRGLHTHRRARLS